MITLRWCVFCLSLHVATRFSSASLPSSHEKTHIQNAKKRLKTMLRHPEKRANIKALAAHFHLIEEKGVEENGIHDAADDYDSDDDNDGDEYDDEHECLDFGLGQTYSTESASGAHHYCDDHSKSYHGGENGYALRGPSGSDHGHSEAVE